MINNWRHFLGLALLLAVAIAGLSFHWQPPTASLHGGKTSLQTPDTIIMQPIMDGFDDAGKLNRHIEGDQWQWFEKSAQSQIRAPRFTLAQQTTQQPAPEPWHLQANAATLFHDRDTLDLQGKVIAQQDSALQGRTEIHTESLHVDIARQFAETDKAVTIRARRSEVHASGLKADLANERLLLPSRVKEIHEVRP
jgi:LPS export ABC transporter protein LptC